MFYWSLSGRFQPETSHGTKLVNRSFNRGLETLQGHEIHVTHRANYLRSERACGSQMPLPQGTIYRYEKNATDSPVITRRLPSNRLGPTSDFELLTRPDPRLLADADSEAGASRYEHAPIFDFQALVEQGLKPFEMLDPWLAWIRRR